MIAATQRKLSESQFFFRHLLKEGQDSARKVPEAFGFYLSAFLSAARSVTFTLQHEETAKYAAWFDTWFGRLSEEDQDLFRFLKDQRNKVQKRGGADVITGSEYVTISPLLGEHLAHTAHGFPSFGDDWFPTQVEIPVHSFQSSRGDQDVISACKRYLDLLERLVNDFLANKEP